MTTAFSKHSNLPNTTEEPQASAKTSKLDKLDVDLIDKIKTAITGLRTTQQRKRKSKFKTAKFPCSVCEKTAITINMQFFVHIVKDGYTVNGMQHQSKSMKGHQVRQVMHLFSVYFVS